MSNPDGYFGTLGGEKQSSEYNALAYVVRSILAGRANITLVQVMAVTPGTPQSAGTVDVQPMVNQIDADGKPLPHGIINNLPWFTLQSGLNAVLLQPEIGDRGLCVFADRDISSVKATRAIGNPGSLRQDDMADGLYLGGFLNDDPTQWIKMDAAGIVLHSPIKITLEAPNIALEAEIVAIDAISSTTITTPTFTVNGASQFNGNVGCSATITAATDVVGGGKHLKTHTHSGVVPGGGTSGPPV